jgi:integrase
MRGDGRIMRYPGSRYWYMAYFVNGKEVRESTKETDEQRARRVLRSKMAEVLRGEAVPHENKLTLADLCDMLTTDYATNGRRSLKTLPYSLQHLRTFFGDASKARALTTDRMQKYVLERQRQGAANATINIELALLGKAFTLAVRARRLKSKPYVPRLAGDPSRVRRGFFNRDEVEQLAKTLPSAIGDVVLFLFFSTWRVGEARTLLWRDYDRTERVIRLRPEHSKNKHGRLLPVEGELATIIERRWEARRLDCPYVFHRDGKRIGDFRKVWDRGCQTLGFSGRIVHDLRRSGVRHLVRAGVPLHTVMAMSGHRTASMLKRYDIISLDDLRDAARRGSEYDGQSGSVKPLRRAEPVENP